MHIIFGILYHNNVFWSKHVMENFNIKWCIHNNYPPPPCNWMLHGGYWTFQDDPVLLTITLIISIIDIFINHILAIMTRKSL